MQPSHFVRRYRSSEPFEFDLADRGGVDDLLDGRVGTRTDQVLHRRSPRAESRGEVRHGAERAVVVSALEADPTEGRMSRLYADAESKVSATLPPRPSQLFEASRAASAKRTA